MTLEIGAGVGVGSLYGRKARLARAVVGVVSLYGAAELSSVVLFKKGAGAGLGTASCRLLKMVKIASVEEVLVLERVVVFEFAVVEDERSKEMLVTET